MISDLRKQVETPLPVKLPPSVSVVNSGSLEINSNVPFTVLAAHIELIDPSRILISGVISGEFHHVTGIAIYVNGVPIRSIPNNCHPDCMYVTLNRDTHPEMTVVPFEVATCVRGAGQYEVRVATLCHWLGHGSFTTHVNSHGAGGLGGNSTLTLRAI